MPSQLFYKYKKSFLKNYSHHFHVVNGKMNHWKEIAPSKPDEMDLTSIVIKGDIPLPKLLF